MTQKERMLAGELYDPADPDLAAERERAAIWSERYAASAKAAPTERHALLQEGLGSIGSGVVVRSPFHCDYGYNIHLDNGVFLNFGCIILDVASVRIGAGTQIGPGVQLLTADHPRDPTTRAQMLELGRPITIGRNVWIGGGALILPGITIGDDAIIGAGSVVTRAVAKGTTVGGNPARSLAHAGV